MDSLPLQVYGRDVLDFVTRAALKSNDIIARNGICKVYFVKKFILFHFFQILHDYTFTFNDAINECLFWNIGCFALKFYQYKFVMPSIYIIKCGYCLIWQKSVRHLLHTMIK